jgi:hypothetical protein
MTIEKILEFLGAVLLSSTFTTIFISIVLKYWIIANIEQSIKHKYDKKLEEIRYEIRKREQSSIVAELFSKWIFVKDEKSNTRELNKLSFEMSLWLPDDMVIEINKRLKNLTDAKPAQDLLVECRKIIQQMDTKVKPGDITFFGV